MLNHYRDLKNVFGDVQAKKLALYFYRLENGVSFPKRDYPHVTREKIREFDNIAIEKYKIPSIVLMENAGAGATRIILACAPHGPIAIFCGRGNNGGDGFVIARHLHNIGIEVQLYFVGDLSRVIPRSDPGINLEILRKMHLDPVEINNASDLERYGDKLQNAEILVDALLGTGLSGPVRAPLADIMKKIEGMDKPVVAIDIPSGLDANTGEILGTAVPAFLTVTFALPKQGFIRGKGPETTGEVVVVDISLPRTIWQKLE